MKIEERKKQGRERKNRVTTQEMLAHIDSISPLKKSLSTVVRNRFYNPGQKNKTFAIDSGSPTLPQSLRKEVV